MTTVRFRTFDGGATAISVLILLAAALLVARLCMPSEPWTAPAIDLNPDKDVAPLKRPTLDLSDLAVIWQRDLRQPVIDPPEQPQQPKPGPKLAVRLVGTAVERNQQYGVFQLADNRTVVKPVGDEVDGYQILAIERGRACLRNGGREYELKVPWYDRIAASAKE